MGLLHSLFSLLQEEPEKPEKHKEPNNSYEAHINTRPSNPRKDFSKTISHPDYGDNMNSMLFSGKARFIKTGRVRKVLLEAYSESDALDHLMSDGYDTSDCCIKRVSFDRPSDSQLALAKKYHIRIPDKSCMRDVSALLSFAFDYDRKPPKELINFAGPLFFFSYYSGEKLLVRRSMANLKSREDKFCFYIAVVRRDLTGKYNFSQSDKPAALKILEDQKVSRSFDLLLKDEFDGYEPDNNCGKRRACYLAAKKYIQSGIDLK